MGRFAIVTNEGVIFNTDCGEAIFRVGAAIWTGGVGWLTGEGFYSLFGVRWHGLRLFFVLFVCIVY